MKLKILVNHYKDREHLVNGFANAGYGVSVIKGYAPVYEIDDYYVMVELPDKCLVRGGEGSIMKLGGLMKFTATVTTDEGEEKTITPRWIILDEHGQPEVVVRPTGLRYEEFELQVEG